MSKPEVNTETEENTGYLSRIKTILPGFMIIPSSVTLEEPVLMTLARKGVEKWLIIGAPDRDDLPPGFTGEIIERGDVCFMACRTNHQNAEALRAFVPFTKPVTIGNADSFGFGDRIGNAGTAHLQCLMDSKPFFKPILAQQSIRELDRTERSAEEVMDAATWAVFETGYRQGFGSDADHLKTTADIDRMISAGFTMYTIDPSDHVNNESQSMDETRLKKAFLELPWDKLQDDPDRFMKRYTSQPLSLAGDVVLKPSETDILRAAVKYGKVVIHTHEMFRYMRDQYPDHDTEVELSVDETPHPTTPEEHLVVASELERLGVELVSLAPRFCGDFEKGVDYKGDIEEFRKEYLLHQAIAGAYGGYKLSIHSGSDKFRVYEAIGDLDVGKVHVKTAGTSYLEALRALAMTDTELFREILAFSLEHFDTDRKTYHISADTGKMGLPESYSDQELPKLLDDDNARQVFHVTFGSVLTHRGEDGTPGFRDRMVQVMARNEDVYEGCLYRHFRRHIAPFEKNA
ncbi:tagaturonate epimerase family protein [Balneolales bacterium ANBcel1]|nr:tagaturonate epimerase family protein [Balneolales bacterium ANBcel1]